MDGLMCMLSMLIGGQVSCGSSHIVAVMTDHEVRVCVIIDQIANMWMAYSDCDKMPTMLSPGLLVG